MQSPVCRNKRSELKIVGEALNNTLKSIGDASSSLASSKLFRKHRQGKHSAGVFCVECKMCGWVRVCLLWLVAAASPALSQILSTEGMTAVTQQMSQRVLMQNIIQRSEGPSDYDESSEPQGGGRANAAPVSVFSSALNVGGGSTRQPSLGVATSFTRSRAQQKSSEAGILAALKKRQPTAVAEYADFFTKYDISALFTKATADYGFSPNDVADTMAAYWLVAWVVANNGAEPSPLAARSVRDQVRRGIARTDVARFNPARRHQLADEAIFNMIILIETYDYAQKGRISRADFKRAGNATQQAFLGFGADLRQLRLTDAGFVKR